MFRPPSCTNVSGYVYRQLRRFYYLSGKPWLGHVLPLCFPWRSRSWHRIDKIGRVRHRKLFCGRRETRIPLLSCLRPNERFYILRLQFPRSKRRPEIICLIFSPTSQCWKTPSKGLIIRHCQRSSSIGIWIFAKKPNNFGYFGSKNEMRHFWLFSNSVLWYK